jgi:hypothetical protein
MYFFASYPKRSRDRAEWLVAEPANPSLTITVRAE